MRSETFVYSECYKHPHLLFIMIYDFTQTYQHKRDWAMPELVKHRNADRSRPKELEPAYAHLIIIRLHFLFKPVGNLITNVFSFSNKLGEYHTAHFTLEHLKYIIFVHLLFFEHIRNPSSCTFCI